MTKISETPIPAMSDKIAGLQKELDWYKAYVDSVQASNHSEHTYACESADETTGKVIYPYSEGDDYWTIKKLGSETYEDNVGFFQYGVIAIQSCWDDQSELLYEVNPEYLADEDRYFDSLEEVLEHIKYEYDFVKVSCFDSEMPDIKTGDYFVCEDLDNGKFQKSY